MQFHNIPPLFSQNSEKLILGSFPSVKSRETEFFYGYKQNRFWRVISTIFNENIPENVQEKKELILSHKLALWDVVSCCDIMGSSDLSIINAKPNDIKYLLDNSKIKQIFINGKKAKELYDKLIYPQIKVEAIMLPSTSPANAVFSLEKLIDCWKIIK